MFSGSTVEMNAVKLDSEVFRDVCEFNVGFLNRVDVVTEFVREDRGESFGVLLRDGDAPENLHVGRDGLDFDELVDRVCGRVEHVVFSCESDVLLLLNRVGVDHSRSGETEVKSVLDLTGGSNV